jgi:hypothetical protein
MLGAPVELRTNRSVADRHAVFTHYGSQIVRDEAAAAGRVEALGNERGVRARVAYDGLELPVRPSR